MPDDREHRHVVVAVAVGVAVGEIELVFGRPRCDRTGLALAPDVLAVDRSIEGHAVIGAAVAGCDHGIEAEEVGEGPNEVLGRRRREHDGSPVSTMLGNLDVRVWQHLLQ